MGLAFGCVMYLLERFLNSLYKMFLLEADGNLSLKSFIIAGIFGVELHVLLDAPLYDDIKPLYPFAANPFYNSSLTPEIYSLCIWMGILGIIYYLVLLGISIYGKPPKESNIYAYSIKSREVN
jgi:membrane-bound metal-dependent hydrolase YbcI (DUF457 family)